jgi:glutaredoxin
MPEPIRIDIYSRPGCHLCDEAKAVIEPLRERYGMVLRTINVESSADLENRYGSDIPVVLVNGTEAFRHRVDRFELERKLKALWNK